MRYLFLISILIALSGCIYTTGNNQTRRVKFVDVTGQLFEDAKISRHTANWCDLDNDGWVDLIAGGIIYRNMEGKSFTRMHKESGIGRRSSRCVVADFTGDGLPDIYYTAIPGYYYINQGDFKFKPGEAEGNPEKMAMDASAGDIDNDGWPDLYIANFEIWKSQEDFPDIILRNDKGKLKHVFTCSEEKTMRARGVAFCDFNRDGLIDIYVSNYRLMPNLLWVNKGDMKLVERAREYGCAGTEFPTVSFENSQGISYNSSGHTIGSLWADLDNDLQFDLFVGNFSHKPVYQDRPMFLRNLGPEGDYHFEDKSHIAAIPWQESYASPAVGDVDNNGLVDIFFTTVYKGDHSRMLYNHGGWEFSDITATTGIDSKRTYQNAFADFDNDGRLDLMTNGRLFRNVTNNGAHWIKLRLRGKKPNTTAIGAVAVAKVSYEDGEKTYIRQVSAGTGSANQNDATLHFGLGREDLTGISLEIVWPSGGGTSTHNVTADSITVIEQP